LHWQYIYLCDTAQESGSLFWCQAIMRLQFAHVRSFTCRGKLWNLLVDCSIVGLYCVTVPWQWIFKCSLQIMVVGVFLPVTQSPTVGFSTHICFFSRPGCLCLIINNDFKSVFFWSDKIISNFNVFGDIKITLYYSVCMRTSGEKMRISDEAEHVQSISYPHIRWLLGLYIWCYCLRTLWNKG